MESQMEEVGQMDRRKKWVSERWDERFEKRREINEEVQWPASRETLARQHAAATRIHTRKERTSLLLIERERESNVFVLKHFNTWQVKSHRLGNSFYILLCAVSSPVTLPVCGFISQIVLLSGALLSLFDVRIDICGEKPVWCKHTSRVTAYTRPCLVFLPVLWSSGVTPTPTAVEFTQ